MPTTERDVTASQSFPHRARGQVLLPSPGVRTSAALGSRLPGRSAFLSVQGRGRPGVGAPGPWGALHGRGAEVEWGHPGPGGAGGRAAHPEDKAEAALLKGGKMSAWPRATAREPFRRRSRRGPGAGNVLCGTVLFAPCSLLHMKLRGRRGEMRFLTTAAKQ